MLWKKSENRALRVWGGEGLVRMSCPEKVMLKHELDGGRKWPTGRRMFQAEGTAW